MREIWRIEKNGLGPWNGDWNSTDDEREFCFLAKCPEPSMEMLELGSLSPHGVRFGCKSGDDLKKYFLGYSGNYLIGLLARNRFRVKQLILDVKGKLCYLEDDSQVAYLPEFTREIGCFPVREFFGG